MIPSKEEASQLKESRKLKIPKRRLHNQESVIEAPQAQAEEDLLVQMTVIVQALGIQEAVVAVVILAAEVVVVVRKKLSIILVKRLQPLLLRNLSKVNLLAKNPHKRRLLL